jgi:hypothetical protein
MLGAMPIQRLMAVLQALAVTGPRSHECSRERLVERLLTDDAVTVTALAPIMRFSELRQACKICGLETKANRVELLEGRLIGAETGRALP